MGVTSVNKEFGSTFRHAGNVKTLVEQYKVVVSLRTDGPETAYLGSGVPRVGDTATVNSDILTVKEVNATEAPNGNALVWIVTAIYDNQQDDDDFNDDPLAQPPDISWQSTTTGESIGYAYDDQNGLTVPVVNSANFEFDPPPQAEHSDIILSISRNELPPFDSVQALEYVDAVNSDTFKGFPVGTVRCTGIDANNFWFEDAEYLRVVYKFHVRRPRGLDGDGWELELKDVGFHEIRADGKTYRITDEEQNAVVEAHPLNADGTKRDPTSGVLFKKFKVYQTLPFAALGL